MAARGDDRAHRQHGHLPGDAGGAFRTIEVVDGMIVHCEPPSQNHQGIQHALVNALGEFVEASMLFRVVTYSLASPLTPLSMAAVTAIPVSASSRLWLAGNPGPPPSPASVVFTLAILASAFAVAAARTRSGRPRRHD